MAQLEAQEHAPLNDETVQDSDLFEDITQELFDHVDNELKPMEILKGTGFSWEETLNASELLHPKMDTRLLQNSIWSEK